MILNGYAPWSNGQLRSERNAYQVMKQNSRPSKPNVVSIPHSTHPIYKLPAILKLRQQKHADIPECNAPAEVISLNSPAFKNTRTPRDPTKSDFFVFVDPFSLLT